jgi:hypothetical protein
VSSDRRRDPRHADRRPGPLDPRERHEGDPQAGAHELPRRPRVADLEQRHGAETRRLAGGHHELSQRGAGFGQDERAPAQVLERDRVAERVVLGGDRAKRLLGEQPGLDAGDLGVAQRGDGEVHRARADQLDGLGRRALPERQPDARMLAVERGQRVGQPRSVGRADRHPHDAARDAGVAVHVGPRALDLGDDRVRAGEQVRAGGRGLDALRAAAQQLHAELGLEPAHLLRQRRLGDVELGGRAAEVAVARDGREVLELAQLHRLSGRTGPRRRPAPRCARASARGRRRARPRP